MAEQLRLVWRKRCLYAQKKRVGLGACKWWTGRGRIEGKEEYCTCLYCRNAYFFLKGG